MKMRILLHIIIGFLLSIQVSFAQKQVQKVNVDCFGEVMEFAFPKPVEINQAHPVDEKEIAAYSLSMQDHSFNELIDSLKHFRTRNHLDDWLYYQLIRRIADQLAPKAADYTLYTLYKWYLLSLSGYDAILTYADGKILFYVLSTENIYNIPVRIEGGKTYVCLNYHDYGKIDFSIQHFKKLNLGLQQATTAFSYGINTIPELKHKEYNEKELNFTYNETEYRFKIKLNSSIGLYFKNYPSTDYEKHFNIPLSHETYSSLIPSLKKYIKGLSRKDGADFLMHFTRYSFLFKPDRDGYGMEKRNSPEMTLLSEYSDCEDRASLFYYLIKEIYDLPMIVVVYPNHVNIAVQFDKSYGKTIEYKGKQFTICDPTPQVVDLKIGENPPDLLNIPYQIAFAYEPVRKNK